jgi:hypothetical protein
MVDKNEVDQFEVAHVDEDIGLNELKAATDDLNAYLELFS